MNLFDIDVTNIIDKYIQSENIIDLTHSENESDTEHHDSKLELIHSANNNAPEDIRDFEHSAIVGFDPGPANAGICLFDTTTERVIKAQRVSFRQKNEKIRTEILIQRVKDYVNQDPDGYFNSCDKVYIEQQDGNRSNLAIQYSIQTMVGPQKCRSVESSAVKAHFREYFPQDKKASSSGRWANNKRNSVKNGLRTLSDKELNILPVIYGKRKGSVKIDHNIMDSIWIARYACQVYHRKKIKTSKKNSKQSQKKNNKKE